MATLLNVFSFNVIQFQNEKNCTLTVDKGHEKNVDQVTSIGGKQNYSTIP